jgi:hypothetical protein
MAHDRRNAPADAFPAISHPSRRSQPGSPSCKSAIPVSRRVTFASTNAANRASIYTRGARSVAGSFSVRTPPLAHLQCSQRDVDSLLLFTSPTFCFHQLTNSFHKNRGVWGRVANPPNHHPYYFTQKGRKPRTAWGEAIRGLRDDCEDWALRNSLKLSVASSITPPLLAMLNLHTSFSVLVQVSDET